VHSDTVAFIHAKGMSDRVPGKNLVDLGGVPLFVHAVRAAQGAEQIGRVVVDSDSDEILRIAAEIGAEPLKRPAKLADNFTTGDDLAVWQAGNAGDAKVMVQVVPTSPFIKPSSIDTATRMVLAGVRDSVAGIRRESLYLWRDGVPDFPLTPFTQKLPNSDTLLPTEWETTGLYAMAVASVIRTRRRVNRKSCVGLPLSRIEAIDINTPEDLELARIVWAGL